MTVRRRLNEGILHVMLVLYGYVLIKIILFKFRPVELKAFMGRMKKSLNDPDLIMLRLHHGNLTPFAEITRSVDEASVHGLVNLFGNVLIFMPFGLLLGFLSAGRKISAGGALLLSFALSLSLEGAQLLYMIGQFDVDDLILNASGGWLGFMSFILLRRAVSRVPA
ncbi:VanZ family protein [Paenibacillus chartarius]|uniref:VanZ family protein n=1 Tax=Paenibacillus chartarius TaxID=747481 RepID=A0ABV6DVC3_9BACL